MAAHTRNLHICIWNATGVRNKKLELQDFITRHKIDIVLLSETHLRPTQDFKLRNMVGYRRDRQAQGGGTAIYLRRTLVHREVDLPQLQQLEATAVSVWTALGEITFVATYLRPAGQLIAQDLHNILAPNGKTFIGGDWNAKHPTWNSRVTNPRGLQLHQLEQDLDLEIWGPVDPTHTPALPNQHPDVLDIVITQGLGLDPQLVTVNDLSSHHDPVLATLPRSNHLFNQRVHHENNWPQFKRFLNNNIVPTLEVQTPAQIDYAVDYLTKKLRKAHRLSSITIVEDYRNDEPLPPLLEELRIQKNRVRKLWQRTRNPHYRRRVHRLERELKRRLLEWRTETWEDKMSSFLLQSRDEWRLVRNLRAEPAVKRPLQTAQGLTADPLTKAETFATTFEEQTTLLREPLTIAQREYERTTSQLVERFIRAEDRLQARLTTPSEVRSIIKKLHTQKAPGVDKISNHHLKNLPRKPLVLLTRIYNGCLLTKYFPTAWKIARVVPIPKPRKDATLASNYRPISLLSGLGKTFERVIQTRILEPLIADGTIRAEQYGFQRKLSAELQLLRLTEHVTRNLNLSNATAAVFLDIEKAYDKIWRDQLIRKLHENTSIPDCYIKLIGNFLTERKMVVHIEGKSSDARVASAGLPQGSVLSPVLFNIYVNDIPTVHGVHIAQFADDTAFLTSGRRIQTNIRRLQEQLDVTADWCKTNKVKLNPAKTAAIYFTKKRPLMPTTLKLHGQDIPWSPTVTYLGVTLDKQFFFHKHIDALRNKAFAMAKKLLPFFKSTDLSTTAKLRLYKATVLSKTLYGSSVWGLASPTQIKRMQVLQNTVLRWILNASRYTRIIDLHAELRIDTITEAIRKRTTKLHNKVDTLRHTVHHIGTLGRTVPLPWHRYKVPRSLVQ